MSEIRFHTMPGGRRTAFRLAEGRGPTIVFLPGYMSDMSGGKATALFAWARERGQSCLLLDYSGCGASEGAFADGTLSQWRDEVLALIDSYCRGKVILVGSSMGGWLNLLVGIRLGDRLAGLAGIASAPDFTDWGRSEAHKAKLAAGETVFDDNPYGPDPTPMHPGFWKDGEANRLLGEPIAIACPVRLLHGQKDADVPWTISLQLAEALESGNVVLTLIKDGDHRLSRDEDIRRLLSLVEELA